MMRASAPLPSLLALFLGACHGVQTSASGDGTESLRIGNLFGLFLGTTGVVYLIVLVLLAIAIKRGTRHRACGSGLQGEPPSHLENRWRLGLIVFTGATALILLLLSLATFLTDRSIARAAGAPTVEVEVIGHQWWWEVRYRDPVAGRTLHTANELHIPAGLTTQVKLSTSDVIHSLWIPNLAGKQDLIPGRKTDVMLHPLHTGLYRSQCAEFCGMQHARMALDVTVDSPADFARWYDTSLKSPPIPTGGLAYAGFQIFQNRQCASCHNVADTPASGMVAPDLSHIASRRTIAAGTLAMSHANLRSWIADPQTPKPGNQMPKVTLSPAELDALTAYLETLK